MSLDRKGEVRGRHRNKESQRKGRGKRSHYSKRFVGFNESGTHQVAANVFSKNNFSYTNTRLVHSNHNCICVISYIYVIEELWFYLLGSLRVLFLMHLSFLCGAGSCLFIFLLLFSTDLIYKQLYSACWHKTTKSFNSKESYVSVGRGINAG